MSPAAGPLRTATAVTAGGGLACTVFFAATAGRPGLLGAAAATVAVVAFFLGGVWPVLLPERYGGSSPALVVVVLVGYALRLVLVALAASWLVSVTDVDRRAFGGTLIGCALTWMTAAVVASQRPSARVGGAPVRR